MKLYCQMKISVSFVHYKSAPKCLVGSFYTTLENGDTVVSKDVATFKKWRHHSIHISRYLFSEIGCDLYQFFMLFLMVLYKGFPILTISILAAMVTLMLWCPFEQAIFTILQKSPLEKAGAFLGFQEPL